MKLPVITAIFLSAWTLVSCNKERQRQKERTYAGHIFVYTRDADLSERWDTAAGRITVRIEKDSIFFLPENITFLTSHRCLISDSFGRNNTYYIQGSGTICYRSTAEELHYRAELSYPTTPIKRLIEFRGH